MNNSQKNQKGAVAIFVAAVMLMLIAFTGLAVDVGYMFMKKNELQNVADAVALACIIKNRDTACGDYATSLGSETNVTGRTDITPPINPQNFNVLATYPYSPCPSSARRCAKASADMNFNPFFMKIFGYSNLPIRASAVAARIEGVDCLVVRDLLSQNGTPIVYGPNCDVNMGRVRDVGNTDVNAYHNYIYNSNLSSDCSNCTPPAIPRSGPVPVPSLSPNEPTWDAAAPSRTDPKCKNATCNLLPGRYDNGIDCSGAKAKCILASGKYYLNGPLILDSNNGTSTGSQVFFYMNGNGNRGDISVNAGGVSSLTGFGTSTGSCASNNYQLLFYSPPGNSGQTFSLRGGSGSSIVGNIYLPSYYMDWRGTNAMSVDGTVVVDDLDQNGTNSLTINPTKISCHFNGSGRVSLIE